MKHFLCLIFTYFLFSFAHSAKSNDISSISNEKQYFKFDKVVHYSIKIHEDDIMELLDDMDNKVNRIMIDLLLEDYPVSTTDASLIRNLGIAGFISQEITPSKHEELNQLFRKKKHKELYAYGCMAEFRDVLIFYSQNTIVGVAKICFSCDQHWIIGTKVNTDYFGMSGDYDKLHNLLYKKN